MKKRSLMILIVVLLAAVVFIFVSSSDKVADNAAVTCDVRILEMNGGTALAEDAEAKTNGYKGKYFVSIDEYGIVAEVGDILRVTYSGMVQESHPAQFVGITSIEVIGN